VIAMSLAQIASVVGGEAHADSGSRVIGPAFLDSRVVELGGLFVAFDGEQVDGHDYAQAAMNAGAAAVLGTRRLDVPMVVVEDPVEALGRLARHLLSQLPQLVVIALTGSQGKTGTKDLLTQVLSESGTTVATIGSLNNEIGLPLTVLRADTDTRYLVVEMGSRGIGHLSYLCDIARPDVSLVLNVGKAHLGEFGTQADIARAKGEIVDALAPSGTAVLNADDPLVAAMAERTSGRVVTYGQSKGADLRIMNPRLDDRGRARFHLRSDDESHHVELELLGGHQASNAAAASAVATALGVPLGETAQALGRARATSRWRMELHRLDTGVTVVNDAYNANPDSMRAALETLAAMGRAPGTRTVAVLGEMRELGASSTEEHEAVGRLAVRLDINRLLLVGEAARPIFRGAGLEGSSAEESVFVNDNTQALGWLEHNLAPGDVVLFKASRLAGLESLAGALIEAAEGGGPE